MSYPVLYDPNETDFENNGIGILSDIRSCLVTEEINGEYELSMEYPMDGIHFHSIVDRSLIKAKPNVMAEPQLFRVYSIGKPMSGMVKIYAQHISYDLSWIPVSAFSAEGVAGALSGLSQNSVAPCPFTFGTDKESAVPFSSSFPASIRSKLLGSEGSILDVYGGEYEFNNFSVYLHEKRGENRGVFIRYGKNLTDIKQDRNCASVATGVYPYWVDSETEEVFELPEKVVNAPGEYDFVKIKTVDFSADFEEKPTEDQLRDFTNKYITANKIGVPDVSISVSFKQLEQSEEYKSLFPLERVFLGDDVNVEFPKLGISTTAEIAKIVYDSVMERVDKVFVGSVKTNIADTIAGQQQKLEKRKGVR